ncbi:cytochrome ubiquinol oxidase subunit I [Pseudonocardia sp. H11422]|uniref:cytochrome ubiquinol oxidase subunit I n=1 Tax=Pseudonocardia sp. H11422 TaxID=2835866 RepID=UPI001BDDC771
MPPASRAWPTARSWRRRAAVVVGTVLSAAFILAANSWMQHLVGFEINPARGRVELTSLSDVLFNFLTLRPAAPPWPPETAYPSGEESPDGGSSGEASSGARPSGACWTWVQFLSHEVWIKGRPGEFGLRGRPASSGEESPQLCAHSSPLRGTRSRSLARNAAVRGGGWSPPGVPAPTSPPFSRHRRHGPGRPLPRASAVYRRRSAGRQQGQRGVGSR